MGKATFNGKEVCCVKLSIEFANELGVPKEDMHFSFPHPDYSGEEEFILEVTEGEKGKSNVCLHLIGANNVLKGMKKTSESSKTD